MKSDAGPTFDLDDVTGPDTVELIDIYKLAHSRENDKGFIFDIMQIARMGAAVRRIFSNVDADLVVFERLANLCFLDAALPNFVYTIWSCGQVVILTIGFVDVSGMSDRCWVLKKLTAALRRSCN